MPVFVDGTAPASRCSGTSAKGWRGATTGRKKDWLHSVFVGAAWVSARLNEGATDGQGDWREQLETDVAPLLAADTPVWLRADNAYYCGALAAYCRERGWDYSISVTDSRKKRPVLRMVAAMELADQDWTPLDPERREEAALVFYQPKSWKEEEAYVVVRQHRGKQGQENAQKGPLTGTGLAPSAVQVLRGEPGVLPVRADRAVAAGAGAVPVVAGEGAAARSAAADPGLRADGGAADVQRAAIADALGAGQPALILADARDGQAGTGLTARAAVRSRLVQLSGERPQQPEGRGASAGVRPGERTGRVGGSGGLFAGHSASQRR